MSGNAPDSAVCSPTQTCHEPKLVFATAGTVCPATWSGSQQSVVRDEEGGEVVKHERCTYFTKKL